jgi:hypothetical protein
LGENKRKNISARFVFLQVVFLPIIKFFDDAEHLWGIAYTPCAACKEHTGLCAQLCFLQRTHWALRTTLFPAKNTLPGFGAGYIEQHDCATRRGNNFRRQKIISVVQ